MLSRPGSLFLSQRKYIVDLLARHNMLTSKPTNTPLAVGTSLSLHDGSPPADSTVYRLVAFNIFSWHDRILLSQSTNSFSLCMLLLSAIGVPSSVYYDISMVLVIMAFVCGLVLLCISIAFRMLIGQGTLLIVHPRGPLFSLLVLIRSHGARKSNAQWLVPQLKRNLLHTKIERRSLVHWKKEKLAFSLITSC